MSQPGDPVEFSVDADHAGVRLDRYLAEKLPALSRSSLSRTIDKGLVRVDGVTAKASLKLKETSRVCFLMPEPPRDGPQAEEIPLEFLHVDEVMAAVNKPPGMVVHPAKGNWKGTLAGALRWHLEQQIPGSDGTPKKTGLSTFGGPTRPGIVHRLDRDTSGVIAVARTEQAHHALAKQFERRTVAKTYLAITHGAPDLDADEINLPIGIHPYQREKMAVRGGHSTSREAVTRYEVVERFGRMAALVRVTPKTGRTHQIRVHLAAVGSPVLCDALYSGRSTIPAAFFGGPVGESPLIDRQALHAARLEIDHPSSGERLILEAPLPPDMAGVIELLRSV
jgi:23S rRNA pseudouridine1911/1915/1917 synthase